MRIHCRLLLLGLLSGCMQAPVTSPSSPTFFYEGPDPYLWLESPKTDSRVNSWLAQQAALTRDWQQQQPLYQQVREQLQVAWDHPKWMVADIKRGQVFFFYNPGLDDYYSVYRQSFADFVDERSAASAPGDSAELLIDGSAFVDATSPGSIAISPDAGWLAYQINRTAPSGDRQSLWYLQSLTSASSSPVLLGVTHDRWTLPAEHLAWSHDADILFFTVSVPPDAGRSGVEEREPAAGDDHASAVWQSRVYSYQPGMDPPAPDLVHSEVAGRHIEQLHVIARESDPAPDRVGERNDTLLAAVVVVSDPESGERVLRWRELEPDTDSPDALARARWLNIDAAADSPAQYVGVIRGIPAFITIAERGTGAITLVGEHQTRTLVAETQAPLRSALVHGQRLVLEYLEHGSSTLRFVDFNGRPSDRGEALALPVPVRLEAMRAVGEQQLLISYSGLLTPPRSELVDLQSGHQTFLRQDRPDLPLSDFQASLVRVSADEGVRVPVWIVNSELAPDRDPDIMLLEVYGGFAAPMETSFSISRLVWLASGGAFAVAGPRGGGDYGEHWHDAGRGERRHNSISDVLTVADRLRSEWLAETGQLVISGRSHGGLLITEAVHRAPALFSALVTDAAVLDLVRLDAFGGARFWQQEYQGFTSSPYHMLLSGNGELSDHPPALLVTRDSDPVVAPAHSFKYVQALQAIPDRAAVDALLSVVPGSGHGSSGRVSELIDDYALRWVFLRSRLQSGLLPH